MSGGVDGNVETRSSVGVGCLDESVSLRSVPGPRNFVFSLLLGHNVTVLERREYL